jgi:hypothetical protein
MRSHVPGWPPEGPKGAPVYIKYDTTFTKQLKLAEIKAEFQASGLAALGIVLDAEQNPSSVWGRVRPFLQETFSTIPHFFRLKDWWFNIRTEDDSGQGCGSCRIIS